MFHSDKKNLFFSRVGGECVLIDCRGKSFNNLFGSTGTERHGYRSMKKNNLYILMKMQRFVLISNISNNSIFGNAEEFQIFELAGQI